VPSSVVQWNGTPLSTNYVDATHLKATIPAADLKTSGAFPVTASNPSPGGGTSAPQTFTVAPASTFYFAEGTTRPDFDTYFTIENPGSTAADVTLTYMKGDGTKQTQEIGVPPDSRATVHPADVLGTGNAPSHDFATVVTCTNGAQIVAERPMYFNYNGVWTGGSDVVGATAPNDNWYFAEGNTLPGFDEYVTVLNPQSTTASLTFHYMVAGVGEKDVTGSVPAHSRATFTTSAQIGSNLNESLWLSSTQPIVAERPMYFDYMGLANDNWTGGHDVVGANAPEKTWYFAEGTTRPDFEEWLTLQNPNSTPITVNATYQLGSGQGSPIAKSYTVPAMQRLTVSVNNAIGPNKDDSVKLTSPSNFIAERPLYFNYNGVWTGGSDVLGANAPSATWFFAEGTTRTNFQEYLTLQNPNAQTAQVTVTYYTSGGQAIPKSYTVEANSRLTVNANTDVGANQDISAKVTSNEPIVAERPMYFNYNGVWTGGHDVVGYVPAP